MNVYILRLIIISIYLSLKILIKQLNISIQGHKVIKPQCANFSCKSLHFPRYFFSWSSPFYAKSSQIISTKHSQ